MDDEMGGEIAQTARTTKEELAEINAETKRKKLAWNLKRSLTNLGYMHNAPDRGEKLAKYTMNLVMEIHERVQNSDWLAVQI